MKQNKTKQNQIYTLFDCQAVILLTIRFNRTPSFALSLNGLFYLTHKWDPIMDDQPENEWTWKQYATFSKAPKL